MNEFWICLNLFFMSINCYYEQYGWTLFFFGIFLVSLAEHIIERIKNND